MQNNQPNKFIKNACSLLKENTSSPYLKLLPKKLITNQERVTIKYLIRNLSVDIRL